MRGPLQKGWVSGCPATSQISESTGGNRPHTPEIRDTTCNLIDAIGWDAWPRADAIVDFGLDSQAHYERFITRSARERLPPRSSTPPWATGRSLPNSPGPRVAIRIATSYFTRAGMTWCRSRMMDTAGRTRQASTRLCERSRRPARATRDQEQPVWAKRRRHRPRPTCPTSKSTAKNDLLSRRSSRRKVESEFQIP